MPSFSTALSGLDSESQALSVISNNLANLNTVGYKDARPQFQDLFYQQIGTSGDGNPVQVGVGATVGAIPALFTQGSIQSTGVPTDVAIQGNGFFVIDHNGLRTYTRAGDFSVGANGELLTPDGGVVLGYPAVSGAINGNATLAPVSIPSGDVSSPKATGNVQIGMNLDANAAVGTTFSSPVAINDTLGGTHMLMFSFTKTAGNTWSYEVDIPAADVGQTGNPVSIASGTLTFDGNGQLTSPSSDVTGIAITGLADGASGMTFNWNLFDSNGAALVTQVSSPSATSSTEQDGYASGTLVNFNIQGDGTIQGIFSNGQTLSLGQIALASFPNEQGLVRNGSNEFLSSLSSGTANIGAPNTGGRGGFTGGALEQSNVDIATEFAQLILAERGYQANSRVVTTLDRVIQDAIAMQQ
jgi:flagellar hook protein FlgE